MEKEVYGGGIVQDVITEIFEKVDGTEITLISSSHLLNIRHCEMFDREFFPPKTFFFKFRFSPALSQNRDQNRGRVFPIVKRSDSLSWDVCSTWAFLFRFFVLRPIGPSACDLFFYENERRWSRKGSKEA